MFLHYCLDLSAGLLKGKRLVVQPSYCLFREVSSSACRLSLSYRIRSNLGRDYHLKTLFWSSSLYNPVGNVPLSLLSSSSIISTAIRWSQLTKLEPNLPQTSRPFSRQRSAGKKHRRPQIQTWLLSRHPLLYMVATSHCPPLYDPPRTYVLRTWSTTQNPFTILLVHSVHFFLSPVQLSLFLMATCFWLLAYALR